MSFEHSLPRVLRRLLLHDRPKSGELDRRAEGLLAAMALVRASEGSTPLWAESGSWFGGFVKHRPDLAAAVLQLTNEEKLEKLASELRPAMRRHSPDLRPHVLELLTRTDGSRPDDGTVKLVSRVVGELGDGFLVDPSCGSGILLALVALEIGERTGAPIRAWGIAATEVEAALATIVCFLLGVDAVVRGPGSAEWPETIGGAVWAPTEGDARDAPAPAPNHAWTAAGAAWARLPPGGRAVLLLSSRRALSDRGAGADRRHELAQAGAIAAVIELPTLPWSRSSHARGAVVVFERARPGSVRPGIGFIRPSDVPGDEEERGEALDRDTIEAIHRAIDAPAPLGALRDVGSFVLKELALEVIAKDDHLDPAFWVRDDVLPSLSEAYAKLAVAEADERVAAEQATAAVEAYLEALRVLSAPPIRQALPKREAREPRDIAASEPRRESPLVREKRRKP